MKKNNILLIGSVLLTVGALIGDFLTPQGFTEWAFYLLPFILISFSNDIHLTAVFAVANSLLLLIGHVLTEDMRSLIVIFHRMLGIGIIWLLYVNFYSRNRAQRRLIESEIQLKNSNQELTKRSAELSREQKRWKQVIQGIADEVWIAEPDGKMSLVNLPAVTHMGLEEFKEKSMEQVYDVVDILKPEGTLRPFEEAPLYKALKGEVVRGEEMMRNRKNGQIQWRQYSAAPIQDDVGNIIGSVAVVRDITEQKRTEQALRESQQDLLHAQAVGKIGSWRLNINRNELLWSNETHRIFGIPTTTAMTYETFLSKVHPDDRAYVDKEWAEALKGKPYDIEHRIIVDDVVKWVREKAVLEFDNTGKLLSGFGIVQDITERVSGQQERDKLLQETQESRKKLKLINENLEEMVIQRTEQVRELAKALTLAEQKERQRLSLLLHEDLQQTLFSAKLRVSLLQECEHCMPEAREDISEIGRLTEKAISTTKSISVELNPPVLRSEGLNAALSWLTQFYLNHFGLHTKTEIREPFTEFGEEERILIVQFVRELLINVIKHAKTKNAELSVQRMGRAIDIRVTDCGVGFDADKVRLNQKANKYFGLFGIEERVRLMGGQLQIESKPGKGTSIQIVIPLPE